MTYGVLIKKAAETKSIKVNLRVNGNLEFTGRIDRIVQSILRLESILKFLKFIH